MKTVAIPDTSLSEVSLLVTRWSGYLRQVHPDSPDDRCRTALGFWASGRITDAVLSPLLVRLVNGETSPVFQKIAMAFAISREAGRAFLRSERKGHPDYRGQSWLDWRIAFDTYSGFLPFLWGLYLEPDPHQSRWDLLSLHLTVNGANAATERWHKRPDAPPGWLHIAPVPVRD